MNRFAYAVTAVLLSAFLTLPIWAQTGQQLNILVITADDIGQTQISAYAHGIVGY